MKLVFDLEKALDKTKLVQVQRTVQGKNGPYTRMQWVNPSDVKDTDRVVGQPNKPSDKKDDSDKPKWSDPTTPTNPADIKVGDYIYFKDYNGGIEGATKVRDIKTVVIPKTGKTMYVFNERGGYERVSCLEGKTVKKYDTKPKQDNSDKPSDKSSAKDTSSEDLADKLEELTGKNMFEIRDMADKPLKKILKQNDYDIDSMDIDNIKQSGNKLVVTAKVRGTYTDGDETEDFEETVEFTTTAKDSKATDKPSDKPSDKSSAKDTTTSGKFDASEFEKIKSDRPKALQYLKDKGISWKESDHAGINWMRACMAASKAGNSDASATKKDSASKPSTSDKSAGKSTIEAKKAVLDMLSQHGNDKAKVMEAAKAQGISWKESDHAGVNWMRASMAIQKHHKIGG